MAVAAAAVVQFPNDRMPTLAVTYVIPQRVDRSAAESERAAAVLAGMFARRRKCHVVPDCQVIVVAAGKTFQQRPNPKSAMAGLWLQAGDAFDGATKVTSHLSLEQSRDKGQARLHRGNYFCSNRLAGTHGHSTKEKPSMHSHRGPTAPKM